MNGQVSLDLAAAPGFCLLTSGDGQLLLFLGSGCMERLSLDALGLHVELGKE